MIRGSARSTPFCAWMLRREATRLGLPRDFKIYDADDQTAVVKLALEQLKIKDPGRRRGPRACWNGSAFAKKPCNDPRADLE